MVEYAYKENGVLKLKPVAMSLSQAQIDEITTELMEAMQPDWQNAISLTTSQLSAGYAAPADGIITGYGYTNSSGTFSVKINDVVTGGYWFSSAFSFLNIQCPINKGDTIKTQNQLVACSIYFVPFKTRNPVSLRPIDKTKIDAAIVQHWDDITSDFSTTGSTAGIVLNYVKYNPVLRMLKYKVTRNQSTGANSTEKHELIYNGSEMIAFNANSTILLESINFISTITAGYEVSSKIVSSNQIEVNVYNRNGGNTWESGHYFTGVIYL